LLLLGIAIFLNQTVSSLGVGRFDLTEEKIYTVSEGTKNILASLEVPVQIKYYVTPESEMPAMLKTLRQDVTDKLQELSIASKGMLDFKLVDPKESEELEEALIGKGIRPFQAQSLERDAMAIKLVYSAIAIGYKDEPEEILPQILPDNLGSLEYELLSRIVKLTREEDPVLAIYSTKEPIDPQIASFYLQSGQPLPEPNDPFQPIPEYLRGQGYDVRPIELTEDSAIPEEASSLLVLAPRGLNDRQRWEIYQVLRRGGNVIVAAQATTYDYSASPRGGYQITVRPQTLGINDLLSEFGIRIDDRLLFDQQMATLAIPRTANIGGIRFQMSEPVQAPMQIRVMGEAISRDIPITAGVPELLYLWGTQVVIDDAGLEEKGLTATTVFTGSANSWTIEKPAGALAPTDIDPAGHPPLEHPTLAVLVEGVFPDPWADGEKPEWPSTGADETEGEEDEEEPAEAEEGDEVAGPEPAPESGRLLVIGCAKLFEELLLDQAGHAMFLLNSVDALTSGDDLISIRSKSFAQRTFGEVSDGKKLAFRIVNMALVPVVVAVFGLGLRIKRRREAEEYAERLERSAGGSTR
jgi:ABC-type uncharacterized transport system involved in gliding motility auxiliary subunit